MLPMHLTAKLTLIDPLHKYSIQPLCLCWCLYKQTLPNLEHAYSNNMCNFTGFERGRHEHKLVFDVALMCQWFPMAMIEINDRECSSMQLEQIFNVSSSGFLFRFMTKFS